MVTQIVVVLVALLVGMGAGFTLAYLYHLKVQAAIDIIKGDFLKIHVRISQVETKTDAVAAEAKSIVSKVETVAADPLPVIK
jgi:hypothetical protein